MEIRLKLKYIQEHDIKLCNIHKYFHLKHI